MQMVKRLFLFFLVNLLIILTLSFFLNLFGVKPYLNAYGLDYSSLALFCLIWGIGGAFISLALSRKMAKWIMRVKCIDSASATPQQIELIRLVHTLAQQAHLEKMPEVGIFNSPEVNAFATGPSKKRALVAVSSGLLNAMSREELEGVLAHEISHITNGDMITMTLIQGVVNAFVMFLARILAFFLASLGNRSKERSSSGMNTMTYILSVYIFEFIFLILGSIAIAFFSRKREFRADEEGARLAGTQKMIAALESLKRVHEKQDPAFAKAAFQSLKISTPTKKGFKALFSSHPPLDERIEKLKTLI